MSNEVNILVMYYFNSMKITVSEKFMIAFLCLFLDTQWSGGGMGVLEREKCRSGHFDIQI